MLAIAPEPTVEVVNFRRTFLRRHVAEELGWADSESHERGLRDVLALETIRRRLEDQWLRQVRKTCGTPPDPIERDDFKATLRKHVNLEEFFYGNVPTTANTNSETYVPVEVFDVDQSADRFRHLTDLIRDLDGRGSEYGVVLIARSGAGKTVAQRRAFFDCFHGPTPELAGFLPCWLRIEGKLPPKDLVENLLLRAAGLEKKIDASTVSSWLRYGPKLLLFCDLNTASPGDREQLAEALHQFQVEYQELGHRCIVAYRSTQMQDAAMKKLCRGEVFRRFEMPPLRVDEAECYLQNIRNYETSVYEQLANDVGISLSPPERDIERECKRLGELVRRHVSNQESLISTPLLMHWVSLLGGKDLDRVETLADLYRYVVREHVTRDQNTYANLIPLRLLDELTGEKLVMTAMIRVALAMLAKGSTKLSVDYVTTILEYPEYGKRERDGSWWPEEACWHKSPYYTEEFSSEAPATVKSEVESLIEFSLLRREGDELRFLHDSLLYYFSALSLRDYDGPGLPPTGVALEADWFPKATVRLCRRPEAWQLPAEFLGGTLVSDELEEIAGELLLAEPQMGLPILLLRLLSGRRPDSGSVLDRIEQAIVRHGSWVHQHPKALFQQCYNDLYWYEAGPGPCREFAEEQRHRLPPDRHWLRQVFLTPSRQVQTMSEHTGAVTCLAVLPDGRVVSGSVDRTVKLWEQATGQVNTMTEHTDRVRCLAVFQDGRVVSGSDDGTVKVWDPATGQVDTMAEHRRPVTYLAVLPNGRVVSGNTGMDNVVRVWDPATGQVGTMAKYSNSDRVYCLAVLPDGRVVSGSHAVRVWDSVTGQVDTMAALTTGVSGLAVLPDGRVVAGSKFSIMVWDPSKCKQGTEVTLIARAAIKCVTCHSEYPRLAAGLSNGEVLILDVEPDAAHRQTASATCT